MLHAQVTEATDTGLKIKAQDESSMKTLLRAALSWSIGGLRSIDIDPEDKMTVVIGGRVSGFETVIKSLGCKFP